MADLDERLNRLISDEGSMKRVLELASAVMGQKGTASSKAESSDPPAKEGEIIDPPPPDLSSVLAALGAGGGGDAAEDETAFGPSDAAAGPETAATGKAAAVSSILPELLQVMSGKGNLLKSDRVNLIKAMQPYMTEKRVGSVTRAMKMANFAKVAKDALRLLGR